MHIVEFAGFILLGGAIGFSLAVAFQPKVVATVGEIKEWHTRLNDLLGADESKVRTTLAILKNDIRQKLANAETKI